MMTNQVKQYKISKTLFSIAILFFILSGCTMDPPEWAIEKKKIDMDNIKIGLSISTLNNPFFVAVRDGVELEVTREKMQLIVADAQNDSVRQSNDIEDLIQQRVDVLLINPVDSSAVSSAILSANQAGIPVITIDRSADKGKVVSLVASDNVAGGKMAAQFILDRLGLRAKVAELEGIPGASATRERGKGFHQIADLNLNVVAKQSADFDRVKGLTVTENMLQAHNNIQAIFAHNDEMALGAAEAVKSIGKRILIIGFDGSADGLKAVKDGRITATIAQQPDLIGQKAVLIVKNILLQQKVESSIAAPLKIIVN